MGDEAGEECEEESIETVVEGVRGVIEVCFLEEFCLGGLELVLPGGRPRRFPVLLEAEVLEAFGRGGEKAGRARLRVVVVEGAISVARAVEKAFSSENGSAESVSFWDSMGG